MLPELLCSFFYQKKISATFFSYFFWKLRNCNLESPPENVLSNIFIRIWSHELSSYDPWNSLLICQFPNYLINKTVVVSNQRLGKCYENNNLELCDLKIFLEKIIFNVWWLFLETLCICLKTTPIAASNIT